MIEAERRLETQFGKKQNIHLWKVTAGVTKIKYIQYM